MGRAAAHRCQRCAHCSIQRWSACCPRTLCSIVSPSSRRYAGACWPLSIPAIADDVLGLCAEQHGNVRSALGSADREFEDCSPEMLKLHARFKVAELRAREAEAMVVEVRPHPSGDYRCIV